MSHAIFADYRHAYASDIFWPADILHFLACRFMIAPLFRRRFARQLPLPLFQLFAIFRYMFAPLFQRFFSSFDAASAPPPRSRRDTPAFFAF